MQRLSHQLINPNLRLRLTWLFAALMSVVLAVMVFAVMNVMRHSLVSSINRDLEDTYRQITGQNLQLSQSGLDTGLDVDSAQEASSPLLNPQLHPQASDNLTLLRRNFPNYSIQIEWTVQDSASMQQQMLEPERQGAELAFVRQVAGQLRQMVGIDPNSPITLSDEQLSALLSRPDQALYLQLPVKAAFAQPQKTQVLVRVADLAHRSAVDGSLVTETAIVYVGKSLLPTESTLATLRYLLIAGALLGVMLGAIAAHFLSGRALRPLLMVQQAAENINSQSLDSRVPEPPMQDEVKGLARAINRMLERLQRSFEAQQRFTSDASHELRTPVTAISGHASYLLRRTSPTESQRESLVIIQTEAERLSSMIASLLHLARSDGGVMELRREPVFTHLLMSDIARELRPLAQNQGSSIAVTGPDEVLEGDHDRLKQVLINLVSNALKAGATHITLSSAPSGPPDTEPGEHEQSGVLDGVELRVADNGPGIAPEHLEKLFDRFYRVEESRSRDQGGAGLGLAIARSIIDAHGGHIWFESVQGQGTTVHVWLPRGDVLLDDDIA